MLTDLPDIDRMLDPLFAGRMGDRGRPAGVRRSAVTEGPAGESLERLTRLAARVLDAPFALVTLMDGDRPYPGGSVGVAVPRDDGPDAPFFSSFCRRVVEGATPLIVDDARSHPLARDGGPAAELGVVSYAGMPLTTPRGETVGCLCVADHRPRLWTPDEVETLQDLAMAVTTDVCLRVDSLVRDRISRELQETVERFRLVMRATNDTIWEMDLETGEGTWNEGIQKMFGYPAGEVSPDHQWWEERIHPDDRVRIVSGTRRAIEGSATTWTDEYRFRAADGAYVTVLDRAYIARGPDGRALRIVGSMIDITEQSRAQQERERLLASETAARGDAERANRAKADFLAVMSHELRTPLTAIMGYTDLLLEGIPVAVPPQAQTQVKRIDYAARHLLELIEQVLLFARVDAAKETLELFETDLRTVAQEAAALIEPLASKQGLAFEVRLPDRPLRAVTESGKARQILLNLLSNAVKFTAAGEVCLTLERDGETALFRVRDTGVGIAPEHLERVFEPFWQAQQCNTREVGGTGLGLAVCRQLAQLLGGEIRVASTPGEGAEFSLRLPCLDEVREG